MVRARGRGWVCRVARPKKFLGLATRHTHPRPRAYIMYARTLQVQSVTLKHERDPQASASRVIKVCDEVPCRETPLDEANFPEIFKSICDGVEPTDTSTISRRVVQPYGQGALKHALVSAVHTAWVGNYPLVLTPDVIWTAIQQGQARDSSFVPPPMILGVGQTKRNVSVVRRIDATGSDHWPDKFQSFTKKLKEADPSTCTPSFSTSGEQEKAVAQLSLMNVHVKDYNYVHVPAYGIPTITLTGTKDDWTLLRDSALALASKCTNAPEWSEVLKPVLNQFISAASGEVDQKFWKSIYHCYGDTAVATFSSSGWIFAFLPFLQQYRCGGYQGGYRYESCVSQYLKRLESGCATPAACITYILQPENGIRCEEIPSGILTTTERCNDLREGRLLIYQLHSGFVAVGQDGETMAIRPEIGWASATRN